jgi:hypothetical protein
MRCPASLKPQLVPRSHGKAAPPGKAGLICLRCRNALAFSFSSFTLAGSISRIMDPLSVAASIAGLLAISGKLSSILSTIAKGVRDAPGAVFSALSEVKTTNAAIAALQELILKITSISMNRRALIGLEPLLVTLSETVLKFEELDALMAPFADPSQVSWWIQWKWFRYERKVARVVERLQSHKNSIQLMLNILQW